MPADTDVEANLLAVRERVAAACQAAGRAPGEVEILLATKTVPADRVAAAVRAGARLMGENRVQELTEKDVELADLPCERHFIGHLQSNKVNQVLRYVSCIQSLDTVQIADRLQRRLETLGRTLDVLVQVNTSGEDSKFGVSAPEAPGLLREIAERDRLRLRGLMTIGLPSSDVETARPSYRTLREIQERVLDEHGIDLPELSMGMSGDLELAIAEGATMVRVGSAVFGHRPPPPGD